MFFKRKKKPDEPSSASGGESETGDGGSQVPGRRRHYRRSPSRKHALGVTIARHGKSLASAEVADLAIGGACIVFAKSAEPPPLEAGDEVELTFTSLTHPGQVRAAARFVRAQQEPDGTTRHSLAFVDVEALFPQLDPFFWNFFNRRKVVRVRPALDRKLHVSLRSDAQAIEVAVNDLSVRGLGLLLDAARAQPLLVAQSYQLSFAIPGCDQRFAARADRRHATSRGKSVLFGLEFADVDAASDPVALQHYVASREAEMARWE